LCHAIIYLGPSTPRGDKRNAEVENWPNVKASSLWPWWPLSRMTCRDLLIYHALVWETNSIIQVFFSTRYKWYAQSLIKYFCNRSQFDQSVPLKFYSAIWTETSHLCYICHVKISPYITHIKTWNFLKKYFEWKICRDEIYIICATHFSRACVFHERYKNRYIYNEINIFSDNSILSHNHSTCHMCV